MSSNPRLPLALIPQQETRPHLDYLDGWRGLAIALLLAGHFFPVDGINLGALGVNFFFVLSGWLMTRLLFVQQTPLATFYRRRISRILPAHLAFLLLVSVALYLTGRPVSASETGAAALFLNNYWAPEPGQALMPFGHVWSLSVEEHCYVLLSLIALAARRWRLPAVAGLALAVGVCVASALAYGWLQPGPQLPFDQYLRTEVAGYGIFVSGLIFLALQRYRPKAAPAALVLALLLLACVLHWWSVPAAAQKILGVGALALAVNLLTLTAPWLQRALSWRPLCLLGTWSFSLYLWQQPFYLWSRPEDGTVWWGLAGSLAAGLLSFYALEQPLRRWLNRRWDGSRVNAA
ncbi:acyltransferase [Pelomonas sp. V22]|uniref:acyltransferase family protein n=1 Tax=Pelomonas sp. V22 TaxID=2822139 RepID=UPI0024A7BBD2|nr:acyltransferase [Pelomonas sp. V22]MDI4631680.1 acyltransferase [Pelomonas sp. V22]